MKTPLYLTVSLRLGFIILLVVLFFVGYNSFLVDKSLIALDASLQSLKKGETLGVALLLNIDSANEIVKDDFNENNLAKLDYVGSTIIDRPASQDAQIILSNLIGSTVTEKRTIKDTLEASNLAFKRGLNSIFGRVNPQDEINLKQKLKEATKAHASGDFDKAEALYLQVGRFAGASRYGDIASILLDNLKKQLLIKNEVNGLVAKIREPKNSTEAAKAYFKLGLLEIQLLNFAKAKEYFNKILEITPDSDLSKKANFYLGYSDKQSGNFEESIKYFEEAIKDSKEEKLITIGKFQIADNFKRQGEYEKAAELFRDIASKHEHSQIAATSLAFAKFTYLFDLNNSDKANEITTEMINKYPGSDLLEDTRQELEIKEDPLEYLTKGAENLDEGALVKIWSKVPVLNEALKSAENTAAWYAVYMIEGSIDRTLGENLQKNEILTISIDPEFLTSYVSKGLQNAAATVGVSISNFKIGFPQRDHAQISGLVKIGPANFKFYVLGKMSLEKHMEIDLIKGEYNPDKWVIFKIIEGKLGRFDIPTGLANKMMAKAHRIFNQKEIFQVEEFSLMPQRISLSGPVRFTQEELKMQRNLLDQYIKFYK
ncbi:MAG: tetratricopeptide repeat protein [Candidatus Omnitrophica bacterium]|nr:tetratricopeptide repeat protein [Candidatus Omnitrophota bacterium]